MIPINLTELATLLDLPAPRVGGDEMVRSVTTDSRTVGEDEGRLFVAIDGERQRGSDHAAAALRRGAVAVVSPRAVKALDARERIFVVADPRVALLRLAADQRRRCPARVAAITGSNGKTTTKDLLGTLMSRHGESVVAANSFNNAIGLSLTLLEATSSTESMILEIGTNAPGEVATLTGVARPHLALITCIAPAHVEGLGGIDGIRSEKLAIAEGLVEGGVLFLNGDDPALAGVAVARRDVEVRTWGFGDHCDLRGLEPEVAGHGVSLRLSPEGPRIEAALLGRHNLSNLLAASVLARALGLTEDEIAAGARLVRPTPLRMERRHVGDWLVIFDCYNANPGSMAAALDELVRQPAAGRRVAILGDMLELGSEGERHHQDLGMRLAELELSAIIFVGPAMRAAQAAAASAGVNPGRLHAFDDARACRGALSSLLRDRDTVLLKGSRGMVLETIFDAETGA